MKVLRLGLGQASKQADCLAKLQHQLTDALALADKLNLAIVSVRISDALERTRELRAQIPTGVQSEKGKDRRAD